MSLQVVPASTTNPSASAPSILYGRRLVLARVIWIVVALVALGFFVAAIVFRWTQLSNPADGMRGGLAQLGLSVVYPILLEVALRLSFFAVAALIFWRKSDEWMALFVSLTLIAIGATPDNETIAAMEPIWRMHTAWWLVASVLGSFGWTSIWLLLYLFPDGHFVPRWTRPLAVCFITSQVLQMLVDLFPNLPVNDATWFHLLRNVFVPIAVGACFFAQIYRYRRVSSPVQRQQTKWFVFGVTTALVVAILFNEVLGGLFPLLKQPGSLPNLAAQTILIAALFLIPVSIGVAILRYRLWDIDVIINRTLVYGTLTASVVGIYVLVVGYLSVQFQASGNLAISLVATGLVAVLFQPLRDRLQRAVNRLMYGERDEPYAVISRLGQRLEATLEPDTVLPTIVETVREALKLPYVAIALEGDQRPTTNDEGTSTDATFDIVAASGVPRSSAALRLPLVYQHETVGLLILEPRAPGEAFGPADRRLLDDLARQAGVAAHAVRLTADLQRSRERLVTAREEERRRLRRDLHDGLGPTLAAQTLKVGSARYLLEHDPATASKLLGELEHDIDVALQDIRCLVHNLRPPALDELGLVGAMQEQAAQYGHSGLHITIDAPEKLPPLPAAVEVAAYRIVQEALTNVARHAHAHTCNIRLTLEDAALNLEITDDGIGLPPERHTGVGLHSMRERAEELGGTCVVESTAGEGTGIRARLPLL